MSDSQTEAGYVSLPAAAMRLGCSWGVAWRKLLTGQLEGKQTAGGRWLIGEESIERLERAGAERQPVPAA